MWLVSSYGGQFGGIVAGPQRRDSLITTRSVELDCFLLRQANAEQRIDRCRRYCPKIDSKGKGRVAVIDRSKICVVRASQCAVTGECPSNIDI